MSETPKQAGRRIVRQVAIDWAASPDPDRAAYGAALLADIAVARNREMRLAFERMGRTIRLAADAVRRYQEAFNAGFLHVPARERD